MTDDDLEFQRELDSIIDKPSPSGRLSLVLIGIAIVMIVASVAAW